METTPSSGAGSRNSATYTPEALRFEEEIHSLMRESLIQQELQSPASEAAGDSSSFTALLGLAPNQAVELLHGPEPAAAASGGGGGDMWRHKALQVPLHCSPTFPSNAALVERAARFSVYAAEDGDRSPKIEPADYGEFPVGGEAPRAGKRKEGSKVKGGGAKKSKSAEEATGGEKLGYVHVRARRGQATDSHSLAERARREKINARMKLLQELVPGCSKITGTALVLDEIINHVQTLQRQVEFLSMRLAAVNPRIDFSGLDSFLSAECARAMAMNGRSGMGVEPPFLWPEGLTVAADEMRRQWHIEALHQQQQHPHQQQDLPSVCWERGDDATPHTFIAPTTSHLYGYDTTASVPLPNQLKTEL